jgi:hypothetical protein
MNPWIIAIVIVIATVALYALHRALLWLEREGWIRYIHNPPSAGDGTGAAFGELQRLYEPQTRHVYEMKDQQKPRRDAEGDADPPKPS